MTKDILIFTDGACSGNPGPGGWAALLVYKNTKKTIQGSEEQTTNNRMEMMAAIEALKLLKEPCNIKLYTDSKYLQNGANIWMKKWQENNWKTGNKLIKNDDLWIALNQEMKKHSIEFHWVKGHSNHPENELVDKLAREACIAIIKK